MSPTSAVSISGTPPPISYCTVGSVMILEPKFLIVMVISSAAVSTPEIGVSILVTPTSLGKGGTNEKCPTISRRLGSKYSAMCQKVSSTGSTVHCT